MEHCDAAILQREAHRRLDALGLLATSPHDYHLLRTRSQETWIPAKLLWTWCDAYQQQGFEGLLPSEWTTLDDETQIVVAERERQLGEVIHAVAITDEHVKTLVERNSWSQRTAERWIRRYQVGGWWGLAPKHDPEKPKRHQKEALPRALGALDDEALEETFRRRSLLGDLTTRAAVSRVDVNARAESVHVSSRTLWLYLQQYRRYGLAGLAPQCRNDKGTHHTITREMEEIIRGIRFSQPAISVRAVHVAACQKAHALGEDEPSLWQVRAILGQIPKPELLIAEQRDDDFRSRYEVTRRMEQTRRESFLISYQIDNTLVDVLVQDKRGEQYRTDTGMIRPWLTLCIDSRSRVVMAAVFGYDRPDRHTVAAAIREAVLVSSHKPYGGIPHEIWVDNGKEFLSHHVEQLTQELHIQLQPCTPHRPQQKPIVERFFGTLTTRLWSQQPGYVSSNTVERDPHAKAELTLAQLEERFWAFIDQYHQETHSQTGESPRAYWTKHCYAEPADPRLLDILLKEPAERTILKDGIHYETRIYWHSAFATRVGERVLVRAEPLYRPPDDLEIYSLKGHWLCTALATDSVQGQEVTRQEIITAKQEQKRDLQRRVKHAREAAASANAGSMEKTAKQSKEIKNATAEAPSIPQSVDAQETLRPPLPSVSPDTDKERPRDLFERLGE